MSRQWVRAKVATRCGSAHSTEHPRLIAKGEWMEQISFRGIYAGARKRYRCLDCAGDPPPTPQGPAPSSSPTKDQ